MELVELVTDRLCFHRHLGVVLFTGVQDGKLVFTRRHAGAGGLDLGSITIWLPPAMVSQLIRPLIDEVEAARRLSRACGFDVLGASCGVDEWEGLVVEEIATVLRRPWRDIVQVIEGGGRSEGVRRPR